MEIFMKRILRAALVSFFSIVCAQSVFAAQSPHTYFKNLKDGQTVTSPVEIEFGVEGMKVAPAGAVVPGEGHHHLIIDGQAVPKGEVVLSDATHIHFGKGQTETSITLTPGKHTLTLQFANGAHLSYGPEMSSTISVNVAQ